VSTRLVPSASGFLGQASTDAQAGPPVTATKVNRKKNPTRRIRTHAYLYSRPSMAFSCAQKCDQFGAQKAVPIYPQKRTMCEGGKMLTKRFEHHAFCVKISFDGRPLGYTHIWGKSCAKRAPISLSLRICCCNFYYACRSSSALSEMRVCRL
jgi:hypothetical protein